MRKMIFILIASFTLLFAAAVSAKARGIWYGSNVFPYGWGCNCPGFPLVGTHLGLGPGYPGLNVPFSGSGRFGLCRSAYGSPARVPRATVFVIHPSPRIQAGHQEAPSGRVEKDGTAGEPARAVAGSNFRRPAPAIEDEMKSQSLSDPYMPRRYYQGKYYEIDPGAVFDSDPPPGIIIWERED